MAVLSHRDVNRSRQRWKAGSALIALLFGVAVAASLFGIRVSLSDRFNPTTFIDTLPQLLSSAMAGNEEPVAVKSDPDNVEEKRLVTDTGVDLSDPALYQGEDLHGDSSTATVMGMASGYDIFTYQRFIGSLRKSGFKGHIILGLAPDVKPTILEYFKYRQATPKILKWADCTYRKPKSEKKDIFKKTQCEEHYPDIKVRWSRFPLQADWIRECEACTGPILIMDVRDSYFQQDPFGPGSPVVKGLQVFEEDPSQTTEHWLTKWPIQACKGVTYVKPMLCSGTTVGTRVAMLKYLEIMYEEMKVWIQDEKCRFDINGDDQSIHNYLYYSGQLPFATAIQNRKGGIVNTVGKRGAMIRKAYMKELQEEKKMDEKAADKEPYRGSNSKTWIGPEYDVTDENGFFTELDGSRSRVVHQWDRFGIPLKMWIQKRDFARDTLPDKDETPARTDEKTTTEEERTLEEKEAAKEVVSEGTARKASVVGDTRTKDRGMTDAGVDVSDPALYEGEDLHGDSSTATVMGMASGYDITVYHRFIGSLRKSGFKGNIILGVAPDVKPTILEYFEFRKALPRIMQWGDCTYEKPADVKKDIFKNTKCEKNYPDIKIRWSRFPLIADWLRECETCTGPVLIMDVRDSFFQKDPFGPGSPVVKGLQVFEEDPSQFTTHWLTNWPIKDCKGLTFKKPMLCSGTTVGTRVAMLKYLEIMYEEMKVWINDEKCRFDINGDDQSIHNYLFYTGQLPFATNIINRSGGIVNTVGKQGAIIRKAHMAELSDQNIEESKRHSAPYKGAGGKRWIGVEFNVTDDEGLFSEADGSRSRVVHQYDRFGIPLMNWLGKQDFVRDKIPEDWTPGQKDDPPADSTVTKTISDAEAVTEEAADTTKRRLKTDTGVDISDPALYDGVDLRGDSSTATVMGMASGYGINVYQRFVGTLRKSGFKGNIILGVAPDVPDDVLEYFAYRDVQYKKLEWANCTYRKIESEKKDIFKTSHCEIHYPDIKVRWSRFPLIADWLRECEACTGPVLIMDVRDSYFQLDPFGPGSPVVKGLQVFEEHPTQTTQHWLTKWPIQACKGLTFHKTMLCSGTTVGTRVAMLKYLEIMYEEMKFWINDEKCRFDINGDDQSIHNLLYYTGQLPFAKNIINRSGGIVNTVGVHGAQLNKAHAAKMLEEHGLERGDAMWKPFEGAAGKRWIGEKFNVTDDEGFFIEADGSRSRVIHQWDRFGRPYVNLWMDKQDYFKDPLPSKA